MANIIYKLTLILMITFGILAHATEQSRVSFFCPDLSSAQHAFPPRIWYKISGNIEGEHKFHMVVLHSYLTDKQSWGFINCYYDGVVLQLIYPHPLFDAVNKKPAVWQKKDLASGIFMKTCKKSVRDCEFSRPITP